MKVADALILRRLTHVTLPLAAILPDRALPERQSSLLCIYCFSKVKCTGFKRNTIWKWIVHKRPLLCQTAVYTSFFSFLRCSSLILLLLIVLILKSWLQQNNCLANCAGKDLALFCCYTYSGKTFYKKRQEL